MFLSILIDKKLNYNIIYVGDKMTGNNKMVKKLNRATILNLIRINKAISKADIAALTGLSPNAVGLITADLIDEDYIYVSGIGPSKGGRKPELLSLKPNSYYSLGVDIDTNRIRFALIDISSQVIYTSRVNINCVENHEKAFDVINEEIEKNKDLRLLGVGIAVSGLVDAEKNRIVFAPNLKWQDIDVNEKIMNATAYIENEAISSSIFESWNGICQGAKNFICINSKSGIGAGIFIDGKVYRGTTGNAGEVGHITADVNGPKCECGNYGCLELYSSAQRIAEKLNKESIDEVITLARQGNEAAIQAFKLSAAHLGVAISGLVNTLNPEKIVLGKEFVKYAEFILDDIRESVDKKALKQPAKNVEIMVSKEGILSSVLGAAILPMKNLFEMGDAKSLILFDLSRFYS